MTAAPSGHDRLLRVGGAGGGARGRPVRPSVVFLLALVGFGAKAGLFPFHFWLPGAHAGAPSHVSAVMSGVMLKVGLYGILRITSLYGAPPAWWGGLLLVLGATSALYGAALAAGQNDLKRLLAYSSIENVGIISTGIGVALLGRSAARPEWVALGLGGALLHVLFHSLFKPLLFLGAGAVIHGTGTREMDLMGGLLKKMPKTGAAFAIGCAAVAALPPLNGFFSEFLVYLGLLRAFSGPGEALLAGFAAPALALAGGVALAAFVKLFGIVFLGNPRSEKADARPRAGPLRCASRSSSSPGPASRPGSSPRSWPPGSTRRRPRGRAKARAGDARSRHGRAPRHRRDLGRRVPRPPRPHRRRGRVPPPPAHGLARPDVGLRLRPADGADAVHGQLLRRLDRGSA